jgi:hypothetical protein
VACGSGGGQARCPAHVYDPATHVITQVIVQAGEGCNTQLSSHMRHWPDSCKQVVQQSKAKHGPAAKRYMSAWGCARGQTKDQ